MLPQLEVIGWFSVGTAPQSWETSIQTFLSSRFENPLLLLLNPDELDAVDQTSASDIPLRLFEYQMEVLSHAQHDDVTARQQFLEMAWKLETGEAERIAVDHVSRTTVAGNRLDSDQGAETALISHYTAQANAIRMLSAKLISLKAYVQDARSGKVPIDQALLRQIQALLQRLPVMQSSQFKQESSQEQGDVLLTKHLSEVMLGSRALSELIETYAASTLKGPRGAAWL